MKYFLNVIKKNDIQHSFSANNDGSNLLKKLRSQTIDNHYLDMKNHLSINKLVSQN